MKYRINGRNYISLLFIPAKLFKFEIKKCGQILCAHKPYFLMPGHILSAILLFPASEEVLLPRVY